MAIIIFYRTEYLFFLNKYVLNVCSAFFLSRISIYHHYKIYFAHEMCQKPHYNCNSYSPQKIAPSKPASVTEWLGFRGILPRLDNPSRSPHPRHTPEGEIPPADTGGCISHPNQGPSRALYGWAIIRAGRRAALPVPKRAGGAQASPPIAELRCPALSPRCPILPSRLS